MSGEQTVDNGPSVGRRRMTRAEVIGLAAAALTATSVLVGVLAWQFPISDAAPTPDGGRTADDGPASEGSPSTGTGAPGLPAGGPGPVTSAVTHLAALDPQAGGANLTELPRELRTEPGYERALVIRCPTNHSHDKVREVTYLLRGRYLDFSATVRPHFTAEPDARARVTVLGADRQRDGTLRWTTRGTQFDASTNRPGPVTARVDGAQELTLQVQCEHPEGSVILLQATLTTG